MARWFRAIGFVILPILLILHAPLSAFAAPAKDPAPEKHRHVNYWLLPLEIAALPVAIGVLGVAAAAVAVTAPPVYAFRELGLTEGDPFWRPAAARMPNHPQNELPMYGGLPKTPAMLKADEDFIKSVEARTTRSEGADRMVSQGWSYFFRKDYATAMKRFNQAWLLDPNNGDAFHGFALVALDRDHDLKQGDDLFRQGLAAPRQSPGVYLDYGRFLVATQRNAEALEPLNKALSFPDMGPDARALLTIALYESGDVAAACAESAKVQDGAQQVIRDDARKIGSSAACQNAQP